MLKQIITQDNFFIAKRLKEIDPNYFLVFVPKANKFEVHSLANKCKNTYVLTSPFDRLDERLVWHVQKTRAERVKALVDEIERQNEILAKQKAKEVIWQGANSYEVALANMTAT